MCLTEDIDPFDWRNDNLPDIVPCEICGEYTDNARVCDACQGRPMCEHCSEPCDRPEDGEDATICFECRVDEAERLLSDER
jgi:hypothetical protein